MPDWTFTGTEFDDRNRAQIEAIRGVERLHTGPLPDVPGHFDVITLSHVFEHWVGPRELLRQIAPMLHPDGLLLIQVPDYSENPFELMVADHCTHFCAATLGSLVSGSGYKVRILSTDWVKREITLIAQANATPQIHRNLAPVNTAIVQEALTWLDAMRTRAHQSTAENFGIFGTSIAGTWLFGEIGNRAQFFVDEDIQRAGRNHLGLPILPPQNVPPDSTVFLALPETLAAAVSARLGFPS